jgi:hypothetical protein
MIDEPPVTILSYSDQRKSLEDIDLQGFLILKSAQNKGILYFVACLYSSN